MPYVRANGVRLFYDEAGTGDPLVVVHGGSSDHRNWHAVAPGLPRPPPDARAADARRPEPVWFGAIVAELARLVGHAEVRTYAGAGHAPHLTHPRDHVAAVTESLTTQGVTR